MPPKRHTGTTSSQPKLIKKAEQKTAMVRSRKRKLSTSLADAPKPDASARKRQKGEYHSVKVNAKIEALTIQELAEAPTAVLTRAPDRRLDVFVFGTNCGGELGLGDATKKPELPGPVLNPKLSADTVGVVQLAVGGIHSAALTYDNRILTWGVNDEWTLGRDTTVDSKKTPIDATSDSGDEDDKDDENEGDDDEVELNLKEATPLPVASSHFPEGTVFTQLVATDSATFALASNGLVYGWGTFRDNNGSTLFSLQSKIQRVPTLIPDVKDVIKLVAGAQHVLALTSTGAVFSWGNNEQNQLGRRMINRHHDHPWLVPGQCSLPRGITDVGAGIYHSFAIHKSGQLYAWGSNNFGQTGIFQSAGQSDAVILYPTPVPSLGKGSGVVSVTGGKDHSLALNDKGQCLAWGRIDNKALGIVSKDIPTHDVIFDTYEKPRILKVPTPISGVDGRVVFAAAGTDHSFAITQNGKAYSWGFNAQHQAGHGNEEEDEVEQPTELKNKHVSGKMLVSAAAGGQFSILMGLHDSQTNGVH